MKKVIIHKNAEHNVFFVQYFEHKKHQRRNAAQFDGSDHDWDSVKSWVRKNPALQLVCAISGKPI